MEPIIFAVIMAMILGILVWEKRENRKSEGNIRDGLLDIVKSLTIPPQIPPADEQEVVHNEDYIPEVELDEWMNGNGFPKVAGWGPPSTNIPDEYLPPTELPEP